ncbi:hypothetical protein JHK84_027473 [Glycine max]|nr:hypothetical protein JHK86_027363 [Glycine max]KAG5151001.1 hypothetical protein JHK84_027473 [Glycine max]
MSVAFDTWNAPSPLALWERVLLHSIATRFGSIAAQDRQFPYEKTGFLFVRCKVTGTGPIYVGRAMGQYSRIVYAYTYFDGIVAHGGWDDIDWNTSNNNKTMFFGVYKCWGPGAATIRGVPLAQELDFESAHLFLVNSFVNGRHWITPSDALLTDNIPINQRKKKLHRKLHSYSLSNTIDLEVLVLLEQRINHLGCQQIHASFPFPVELPQ